MKNLPEVQLGIWQLWWECPHCLHSRGEEVDTSEDIPARNLVRCSICKREYIGLWSADLPLGVYEEVE